MKFFFLFLLFPLSLFAHLNGSGDFQIWNTDTINIRSSKRMILTGQTEFRYGRDGSKLYYKHYQGEITFIRSPHTLITPGYRQVYHRRHGDWVKEYQPRCAITFQVQTKSKWLISDRNLILYRIQEGHNRWVYRNRLEFLTPIRITRKGMGPFFSNEFFWAETQGINQNRLIFGLRIPYHQRTQLDLYYMLRSLKNHNKDWIQQNILGLHFALFF
jgi:hypothetical protein